MQNNKRSQKSVLCVTWILIAILTVVPTGMFRINIQPQYLYVALTVLATVHIGRSSEQVPNAVFMFASRINSITNTLIVPTDANYYKINRNVLKQFTI